MMKIEIIVFVSRPTLECTNGQDVHLVIDECFRSARILKLFRIC